MVHIHENMEFVQQQQQQQRTYPNIMVNVQKAEKLNYGWLIYNCLHFWLMWQQNGWQTLPIVIFYFSISIFRSSSSLSPHPPSLQRPVTPSTSQVTTSAVLSTLLCSLLTPHLIWLMLPLVSTYWTFIHTDPILDAFELLYNLSLEQQPQMYKEYQKFLLHAINTV